MCGRLSQCGQEDAEELSVNPPYPSPAPSEPTPQPSVLWKFTPIGHKLGDTASLLVCGPWEGVPKSSCANPGAFTHARRKEGRPQSRPAHYGVTSVFQPPGGQRGHRETIQNVTD
jgi:hypothetical protein